VEDPLEKEEPRVVGEEVGPTRVPWDVGAAVGEEVASHDELPSPIPSSLPSPPSPFPLPSSVGLGITYC
jgi:hypothetical protein